jgi:hypothetical protein
MGEEGFNIYKFLSEINVKYIYLLIFILVLYPVINPIGIPILVTSDTAEFYKVLSEVEPGDKVLVSWNIGFDALMELKSSMYVSMTMLMESDAKLIHAFGHAEGPGMFPLVFGDPEEGTVGELSDVVERVGYTEGEDYIVLGYIFVNEASVNSMAREFQSFVVNDWKGNPIKGTFLDEVEDAGDIDLIIMFSSGFFTDAVVRHFSMDYEVRSIISSIGVSIPGNKLFVDAGFVDAVLGSTRGGAELEYLAQMPGEGLKAMDAFSIVHYFYIIIIILGNIAFFGYEKTLRDRRRTALK